MPDPPLSAGPRVLMIATPITELQYPIEVLIEEFSPAMLVGVEALSSWTGHERLEKVVREQVSRSLQRASDPAFIERQFVRFAGGQRSLTDFTPRVITRSGDCLALAEIRFKGMDPTQPFVELSLLSDRVTEFDELVEAALDTYSPFAPTRARAWFGRDQQPSMVGTLVRDQHLLVGQLGALRERAFTGAPLQLKEVVDRRLAYERYVALHDQYRREAPQIAEELYCSTEAAFGELLDHGMTFDAFLDGRRVGFVAAAPEAIWGQPGIAMQEEFLEPEFRGRGLGRCLQRALIERLTLPSESLLWGTIHDANQPSLRIARSLGRLPIGAHSWIHRAGELQLSA